METVEGYYADFRRTIESLPVHNILVILGDFNTKLGPSDASYSYHEKNMKGKFLSELAQEKELVIKELSEANNSSMAKLLRVKQKGRRAQKTNLPHVIAARELLQQVISLITVQLK